MSDRWRMAMAPGACRTTRLRWLPRRRAAATQAWSSPTRPRGQRRPAAARRSDSAHRRRHTSSARAPPSPPARRRARARVGCCQGAGPRGSHRSRPRRASGRRPLPATAASAAPLYAPADPADPCSPRPRRSRRPAAPPALTPPRGARASSRRGAPSPGGVG
eukprot:scaffold58972_cov63-Phaeocystis_antarctica.AAC.4